MRALFCTALFAAGCYDVDALSASYDASTNQGDLTSAPADMSPLPDGVIDTGEWKALASPTASTLRAVFGDGTGEVFAVGPSSTIVRMAVTHAPMTELADPGYVLRSVWASSGFAIAVGDEGTVLIHNAGTWTGSTGVLSDDTIHGIIGLGTSESVAVASGGKIAHRMGSSWMLEDSGVTTGLYAVTARASNELIAVGEGGVIVRSSGSGTFTWVGEKSDTTIDLLAVWSSATDSYAVGVGGLVLHNSGSGWVAETSNTTADLHGVFGAGDQVWAVGEDGTIISRTNGSWRVERSGGPHLRAVWASGPSDAWAVGDSGTILRRAP